jgi:hypothetical protein
VVDNFCQGRVTHKNVQSFMSLLPYNSNRVTSVPNLVSLLFQEENLGYEAKIALRPNKHPKSQAENRFEGPSEEEVLKEGLGKVTRLIDSRHRSANEAFKYLNTELDSHLSQQEFVKKTTALQHLTPVEAKTVMDKLDEQDEGHVLFPQFAARLHQLQQACLYPGPTNMYPNEQYARVVKSYQHLKRPAPEFREQARATRFGCTPAHTDTFQNYVGDVAFNPFVDRLPQEKTSSRTHSGRRPALPSSDRQEGASSRRNNQKNVSMFKFPS